jgi:basic membrane protein A
MPKLQSISVAFLCVVVSGCFHFSGKDAATSTTGNFRVGIVFDKGGKDDKSFNSAAYRGAMKAKEEQKVFFKYVEATDDNAYEGALRAFAHKNFDLIIAIGFSQAEAIKKASIAFPREHFAIIDAPVEAPNVRSLMFKEHEGSYLVGAAAAMASKTGKIGFIGGMDIPLIRRFEWGYVAGAKKINPNIQITTNFIGVTSEAWNNPAKAKELSLDQFGSDIDVIFAAAGASNSGLFDAVEETHKLAIGVDSNQDAIKPGLVLTSMLKRVDQVVYQAIVDAKKAKDTDGAKPTSYTGGVQYFGLDNQGIDYSYDDYNAKVLTPEIRTRLEQLKADIIAGKIQVPDYYKRASQ